MANQTAEQAYKDLCDEFTEFEMQRCLGGLEGFTRYVYNEGAVPEFYRYMNTPEPDWQRDC